MPQQRKRRRSGTATGDRNSTRRRTTAGGAADGAGEDGAQRLGANAAALNSGAIVDIGGLPCCPADVKSVVLNTLTHDEKTTTRWTFPFKVGDRFDTAEFTQLSCYGPPTNKGRYVLCAKLGEGSFSCVFKGWDTVSRDVVAMKFTLSR